MNAIAVDVTTEAQALLERAGPSLSDLAAVLPRSSCRRSSCRPSPASCSGSRSGSPWSRSNWRRWDRVDLPARPDQLAVRDVY